jgi:hypothetical protein
MDFCAETARRARFIMANLPEKTPLFAGFFECKAICWNHVAAFRQPTLLA